MSMNRKILWKNIRRLVAAIMMFVMILLQPCTVLADSGIHVPKSEYNGLKESQEVENIESEDNKIGQSEASVDENLGIIDKDNSDIEQEVPKERDPPSYETSHSDDVEREDSIDEEESTAETNISSGTEADTSTETDTIPEMEKSADSMSTMQTPVNTYTVKFLVDNVVVDTQTVELGGNCKEPEIPMKSGYTFMGWIGDYTKVTNNRSVYAKYKEGEFPTHKVTFLDYNGELAGNPQYVIDGNDADSPAVSSRPGFTFLGWDKNRFHVKEDLVLNEQFREGVYRTYYLRYYGYSDNQALQRILKEEWVIEGEDGAPPVLDEIDGYTFRGWDMGKTYTNVYSDKYIYADYYSGKYQTHKVEFINYDNKPICNPQYVIDGRDATSPSVSYRSGYTFMGWDNNRYRIHKDLKLKAQYREGSYKTYSIQYKGYCDNKVKLSILKEEIIVEGEDGVPPELEKIDGYTFIGWDIEKTYTNVYSNRIINANYCKGEYKTYKVEFYNYDDKPLFNPQHVIDGKDASSPSAPYRSGYTFTGWDNSWFNIHRDMKLKAQYVPGVHKTYIVSYYGYSNNIPSQRVLKREWVIEGEDGQPPVVDVMSNYTFAGWDRNRLYTNVVSDRNIYASYYSGKYLTHKVEFIDHDGKALINPQYVIDGNTASSPIQPYREGYTFIGWDKEFYRITAPVKIQALYREGNYTTYPVSFYGKITGNNSWQLLKTEYVPTGEEAHPPKLPINAGYTFREWSGQIAGITSSQKVYAQYDETTDKNTYTVRFWRKGELIKTEEVSEGGNATAPTVAEVKGYSFLGWDKSYVNINPKERSNGFIDIIAQFRLTSSLQNTMKLDQFLVALSALKLPLIVESGFSALGYAIVIPFDGNALDLMAALGLGLIIIANWDSVKGQWENLKAIFSDFAGQDAAGEILENIEAGVDEAGKGDVETDTIAEELGAIAGQYGIFKCKEAADAMAEYLKKQNRKFKFITMNYPVGAGYIISLSREAIFGINSEESIISKNGRHYAIEYNGKIYCNVHPLGLLRSLWEADFWGDGQSERTITPP